MLLAEKAAILANARSSAELMNSQGVSAPEDQVPLLHDQFLAIQQRSSDFRKLKQIDAALQRMDTGEFGICLECEDPIAMKRLSAIPWASYCITCQEQVAEQGTAAESIQLDGILD
jgi:DnaK suppressor protein